MRNFNLKESGTWAGLGVMLISGAGFLAQAGYMSAAAILTGLGTIFGGVAGYIPEPKNNVIK